MICGEDLVEPFDASHQVCGKLTFKWFRARANLLFLHEIASFPSTFNIAGLFGSKAGSTSPSPRCQNDEVDVSDCCVKSGTECLTSECG